MIKQIRSLAKSVYRAALLARARRRVAVMRRVLPAELAVALTQTFAGAATPEERDWLVAIGKLKRELEHSQEQIEVVDYGAGSPAAKRSGEDMVRGVRVRCTVEQCARASKDGFWGALLFRLVRQLRPQRCLELGTNLGISAAYQAAAMKLNGGGDIVTLEGAPVLVARARSNIARLGLTNATVVEGRFSDTLPDVCAKRGPFDFVFVDGHHDEHATEAYFREIMQFSRNPSTFVFDDIEWSSGMRNAWKTISDDGRVSAAVNLTQLGICMIGRNGKRLEQQAISLV